MKRIQFLFSVLAVSVIMLFTSCSDDSNNQIENVLPDNTWKVVAKLDDDGSPDDDLSQFNGYTFYFNSSGVFTAMLNSTVVYNGTWSIDNIFNKIIINISGNEAMDEISDDWVIKSVTETMIKLKDDSAGSLEEIHLEKI